MRPTIISRNILFILVFILIILRWHDSRQPTENSGGAPAAANEQILQLFEERRSNVQVSGTGTVAKVLPDDLKGSRHQKMIVRIAEDHTILIAHNIDLAPRVAGLKDGDRLDFYGEYEYTEKGGVVHWTHRDPAGKHPDGWIRHKDTVYR